MEASEEGDQLVAPGGIARQLDRAFDGFGAGIAERDAARSVARRDLRKFLGQGDHLFVVKVRAGHVDEAGRLPLDRFDHPGMAVAGRHHRDSGVEIEKAVAVHVLDNGAFRALRHQRIAARVGRGNGAGVAVDDGARAGAGQRGGHPRKIQLDLFQGLTHNQSPVFSCRVENLHAGT